MGTNGTNLGGQHRRRVLAAPAAHAALLRGVETMTALVRPTLGPLPRTVAIDGQRPAGTPSRSAPEILDSAATIMRRTIQIADPFADMGAMLVRHLAWSVFERVGDGAATAVILAHAILHEAAPVLAAGADPHALRRGIERGLAAARDAVRCQARPIDVPAMLVPGIAAIVRDTTLAETLAEVVEAVGPDGAVLIEDWQRTTTDAEYIDGQRWNSGLLSHAFLPAGQTESHLIEPRILLTDRALTTTADILPALEACVGAGERQLLVVTPEMREAALAVLLVNRARGVLDGALAVRAPGSGAQGARILEDIAVVTGGRALLTATGGQLSAVTIADLGSARQAWATASAFGILGGYGDRDTIRHRIAEAKAELRALPADDADARRTVRERIGKLAGTAAIVSIGALADSARAELRTRVEAAVTAAQAALQDGVVPGGGAALFACTPTLEALADDLHGDEALGVRLLARALTAPMHAIATNAGIEPSTVFADAAMRTPGWTFDVLHREWGDARERGILDPLPVVLAALEGSVSTAVMAMTTDVLVRHKRPEMAKTP